MPPCHVPKQRNMYIYRVWTLNSGSSTRGLASQTLLRNSESEASRILSWSISIKDLGAFLHFATPIALGYYGATEAANTAGGRCNPQQDIRPVELGRSGPSAARDQRTWRMAGVTGTEDEQPACRRNRRRQAHARHRRPGLA